MKFSTQFNKIFINKNEEFVELRFDSANNKAIQSRIEINNLYQVSLKNLQYLLGVLLFIPPLNRILLLGVGAGSLIHFIQHQFPVAKITAVEMDAELLEIMQQHAYLPKGSTHLEYVIEDAFQFLQNNKQQFDLILVDIFDGQQSPAWILDRKTSRLLQSKLSPQGAVAYNLLINSEFVFNKFYGEIRQIFQQQTLCLGVEGFENTLIYALKNQSEFTITKLILQAQDMSARHDINYGEILKVIFETNPRGFGVIK